MPQIYHKDWDINEEATGRFRKDPDTGLELPIMGATLQNGLNDIEPDGSFVPCDIGIEEVTDGVTHLRVKRGRYGQMRFGDSGHPNSFLVKIKNKDLKGVSFKYTGANGSSMTTNNGKPLCHFDNGVSIESTPTYKGVKMDIIIQDPLTAPVEYPFSVKTYGQGYVFVEENGGATLRGEDQDPIFIRPPYAIDANGEIGPVTIQYTGIVNNLITFKKIVDEAWLRQAAAPVKIDPDVNIDDVSGIFKDATLASLLAQRNNNWGGYHLSQFYNGLMTQSNNVAMFADLSSYAGVTVVSAKYILECSTKVGATFTITVNPILRAWNEGTKLNTSASIGDVTANSARHTEQLWTGVMCTGAGTDYNVTAAASFTTPSSTGSFDVNLTPQSMQDKIDGTNYGDIFRVPLTNTASYILTDSSESSGTKPSLYFEYTGAGITPVHRGMAGGFNQLTGGMQ